MTRVLLRGGRVLADRPATAVLVEGGTIAWVGNDDLVGSAPEADRTVELGGRLLTPAFVDAHVHLAATGLAALGVDLGAARSVGETLDLVAAHTTATTLGVVLGHSWDETRWAGGEVLTRAALDRAAGGRPAYLSRVDIHSAHASTALVDAAAELVEEPLSTLAGWTSDGAVSRQAHHAVRDAMLALLSPEDRRTAIRVALEAAAARGIGMVHEMGAPHITRGPGDFRSAADLRAEAVAAGGALPEVVGYWGELETELVVEWGLAGAAGDICVDGAIGSRTAALEHPYTDDPATSGHLYLTAEEIAAHVVACTAVGVQAGFHVIGDRAAAEVVAGFEKAAGHLGRDALRRAGHRLEHVEMLRPEQVEVLGALGLTASMQPLFEDWWGGPGGLYETRLGDRARGMNAFASLRRAGVRLAFGSDSPVTPFDPWAAVRAAVHHPDVSERIDPLAAFEAHTEGGWTAAGRTGGRVEPGAPAYLAVWDTDGDPLAAGPEEHSPTCALTLVGGAVAYDGGGLWS